MKPRHKRLLLIVGAVLVLGVAVALVLKAFRSNLVFFYTPSQVIKGEAPKDRAFRIGGLVKAGSLQRRDIVARFIVTDTVNEIPVSYRGILPDLFKEGRGVVAEGKWSGTGFTATEVLAKHDENYMPPEAKDAVEQAQKTARTLQR